MNRRSIFAAALVVIALAQTPSAWAQGNGNGNNGQGNGNGNAAGNGSANGSGNTNGTVSGNGGSGGSNNGVGSPPRPSNGPGPDAKPVPPPPPKTVGVDDELSASEVLAEVEAGRAVSLSSIMPDIRTRTGGEIIDAQLEQVGSFLLYALTVLTPEGKVSTQYYYARSGLHVEK